MSFSLSWALPQGAFFPAKNPFFDVGGCSDVHLCHKISILCGLLGNLGYLGNWRISLLSVPGQYVGCEGKMVGYTVPGLTKD